MFTGIVLAKGVVKSLPYSHENGRFEIELKTSKNTEEPNFLANTKLGDSIAVDGVCLTVVDFNKTSFYVEVSDETISRTNFDVLRIGQIINLEHAIKYGDSIDGHLVQGHVDSVCYVDSIESINNDTKLTLLLAEPEYIKFIAEKGSITLNGVSLTVNEVSADKFIVNIIPYTLSATNLNRVKLGDSLNIEIDMFARYCVNYLQKISNFEFSN